MTNYTHGHEAEFVLGAIEMYSQDFAVGEFIPEL